MKLGKKDIELTYGEISPIGMKQFNELEPKCEKFMDVGSGYGKFTWIMGRFFGAKDAYGIEIDIEKYRVANRHFGGNYNRNIHFECGDFRKYKNLIKEMDVVYCNCICWRIETVKELISYLSPNCKFYHNSSKYYSKNQGIHDLVKLNVHWLDSDAQFYKLNTNIER